MEETVCPSSNPRLVIELSDHDGTITDDTIICFGMLIDYPVIAAHKTTTLAGTFASPIIATSTSDLYHSETQELLGRPDGHIKEVLSRLIDDPDLECQLTIRGEPIGAVKERKLAKQMLGYLGIIIYGPKHRFEDVGDFMTQCKCFLQDPCGCDRDVPYMNAQCLFSIHETPVTTFSLSQTPQQSFEHFTGMFSDMLTGYETIDRLEEAPSPASLRTPLKPHQRQALTFLLRREQGWHPNENMLGLWAPQSNGHGFINIVTEQYQRERGPMWRGGLLADEMGLGKTLSMIALIASDHVQDITKTYAKAPDFGTDCSSTLIVAPLTLITTWTSQLASHVLDGELTAFVHHGKSKLRVSQGTKLPNIVLTTYHTIEHEQRGGLPPNSLSAYFWKRIILDEAHIIRNYRTSTAQAMAALKARTRWAISGTPFQNSLTDFLGLFKFLQFVPYNDPNAFNDELLQLWHDKPVDEANAAFKKLLSCIMLRRTKVVLDLPPRTDKIFKVSFDEHEERKYRLVEQPVAEMLVQPHSSSWATKIQQINRLRLICNVGTHVPQHHSLNDPLVLDKSLQATIGVRLSLGEDMCNQCQGPVSLPSIADGLGPAPSSNTYYSTCGQMYCSACTQLLHFRSPNPCRCMNGMTPCRLLPLASSIRTPQLTPTRDLSPSMDAKDSFRTLDVRISSKVRALIEQIRSCPMEKHVVFSSWTSSLDMVDRGLAAENIASVRIDGSVAPKNRAQAVDQLRNDRKIRVILLTISCGACGLDLTAASRVHLLEPQWNPSLEDQALARAHRLGQTHPVTTIRYIIRDSFEEHMLKVQDRKKLLASMLLSDNSALQSIQNLLREKLN